MLWVLLVIVVILFIVAIANIVVVQQSRAYVIERLGAFHTVWGVGLHLKIPFIERVARKVSLKEQVLDYPPQPVITKDNVTMQIDTVVYFQITDPKLYAYGVEQPMAAMETLTATTLRNIIGDLELDQTLTSRDVVNTKMRAILDEATDPWGIKVNRVELKNILPPSDIQSSMEKQMKAERDRRQAILQAEGQKKSAILIAEGERESAILRADAEKQAAILKAEAEKQAAILRADGEAQAILAVQKAMADSLELLNQKAPNDQVIKLKAIETMQKVADGKATKIIIPSEMQGLVGMASGIVDSGEVREPAANATTEEIYEYTNRLLEPQKDENMALLEEIKKKSSFSDMATEEQVLRHIDSLENQAAKVPALEDKVKELQEELGKNRKAAHEAFLDQAVSEGRITKDVVPHFLNLMEKDEKSVREAINALPKKGTARVENWLGNGVAAGPATLLGMTWDEIDKAERLAELKDRYPDLYRQKFNEKFGN